METSASEAMVEAVALVIARVFWPRPRASRRAASVSEVSPDWESTSTLG